MFVTVNNFFVENIIFAVLQNKIRGVFLNGKSVLNFKFDGSSADIFVIKKKKKVTDVSPY